MYSPLNYCYILRQSNIKLSCSISICLECRTEIVVTCYKIYEKVSQNFIRLNILKKSDGEAL